MRVVVGVAQLVCEGIQEEVAPLSIQVIGQTHEDVQRRLMHGVALRPRLVQVDCLQAISALSESSARNCTLTDTETTMGRVMPEEHHD